MKIPITFSLDFFWNFRFRKSIKTILNFFEKSQFFFSCDFFEKYFLIDILVTLCQHNPEFLLLFFQCISETLFSFDD